MGDENHIRTLGDYSRPSHEGYRNTIELSEGNNVVSLRSDTICANWFKRLPAGSISTWEDLTTRFLAQFFPSGRTVKLCNDIMMFQQHHGESLSEAWTRFKDLLQKVPHHGIDRWLQIQISYDHVSFYHGKLRPSPQPQALNTTFEARVRDYMAAHTKRMEIFKKTIFKQSEEINGRMTKMFGLFKELTTSRTPEKVLIREEAKFPVTKNLNSISLTKGEEGGNDRTKVTPGNAEKPTKTETKTPVMEVKKINEVENGPN
ncbi:zinc finger, CCHC-type containing protein [Tanacetum coccineum]|uniref:Zinc finger, CCHC-type containing protein n=1 Tax=Tanacetum coccineum TaxID=301880 RepID=A0ABQ5AIR3_9ASTR